MVIKSGSLIIQDFLIAFNNLLLIRNELCVSYCITTVGRQLYRRGGGALLKTFFEPVNILRLHMTFSKKGGGGTCLPAPLQHCVCIVISDPQCVSLNKMI